MIVFGPNLAGSKYPLTSTTMCTSTLLSRHSEPSGPRPTIVEPARSSPVRKLTLDASGGAVPHGGQRKNERRVGMHPTDTHTGR